MSYDDDRYFRDAERALRKKYLNEDEDDLPTLDFGDLFDDVPETGYHMGRGGSGYTGAPHSDAGVRSPERGSSSEHVAGHRKSQTVNSRRTEDAERRRRLAEKKRRASEKARRTVPGEKSSGKRGKSGANNQEIPKYARKYADRYADMYIDKDAGEEPVRHVRDTEDYPREKRERRREEGAKGTVPAEKKESSMGKNSRRREAESRKAEKEALKKKKRMKRLKIFVGFLAVLGCFAAFLTFTKPGNKLLLRFASIYAKKVMKEDAHHTEPFEVPEEEDVPEGWAYSDGIVNILLIGVDESKSNTDSMILVSQNLSSGEITMVSFLRDTYVAIAGTDQWRKLNYAYAHAGIDCLKETIENTYHIYINAYAIIDFDNFEHVIDSLGGVDMELGEEEAAYLNEEDYITEDYNKNLTPGWNHLNGDQALGYCRVRMVPTLEGVNDDFGRTLRQRKLLTALFEVYKDKGLIDNVKIANEILSCVTTNMTSDNIYSILEAYYDHKTDELNQLMIPDLNYMSPINVDGVGSVLSIYGYEQDNIDLLHNTLYGPQAAPEEGDAGETQE